MGNLRRGERRLGAKCSGGSERLMEHIERALERGDRESAFAAIPAARKAAERAGELCAQRHCLADELSEAGVLLFRISSGAQFVEQRIKYVRGALFDRMDYVAVFIPHPIYPLA